MLIHNKLEIGGSLEPPISMKAGRGMEERVSGFAEILKRMVRVEIDYLP